MHLIQLWEHAQSIYIMINVPYGYVYYSVQFINILRLQWRFKYKCITIIRIRLILYIYIFPHNPNIRLIQTFSQSIWVRITRILLYCITFHLVVCVRNLGQTCTMSGEEAAINYNFDAKFGYKTRSHCNKFILLRRSIRLGVYAG